MIDFLFLLLFRFAWICSIVLTVISWSFDPLKRISSYGKFASSTGEGFGTIERGTAFRVLYSVAFSASLFVFITSRYNWFSLLILVHVFQRLLESCFVHVFSGSKLNILGLLLGMSFYLVLCLIPIVEAPLYNVDSSLLLVLLVLVLFAAGCFRQHVMHRILASLRRDDGSNNVYGIPRGQEFELVSCPHYMYEIVIYAAITLSYPCPSCWLMFLFVLINQMGLAKRTHQWYEEKFEKYQKKCAIIPFLW